MSEARHLSRQRANCFACGMIGRSPAVAMPVRPLLRYVGIVRPCDIAIVFSAIRFALVVAFAIVTRFVGSAAAPVARPAKVRLEAAENMINGGNWAE